MAYTPIRIYQGQPTTSSSELVGHTVTNKRIIKNILICNTTSATANLTLYLVPSGQNATTSNMIMSAYSVQPNDTVLVELSAILNANDRIHGFQSTTGALTIHISGVEVT